jgi:hypothetical protein
LPAAARATFTASFEADVGAALGLPASRIRVQGVRAASVTATFAVLADMSGNGITGPDPPRAAKRHQQVP